MTGGCKCRLGGREYWLVYTADAYFDIQGAYGTDFLEKLRPYAHEKIKLAGPAPAPIARIKGKFRYMLTIRGEGLKLIRQALKVLTFHRKHPGDIEVAIDVDPQSLL